MPDAAKIIPLLKTNDRYLGPASIIGLDKSGEIAHIRIHNLPGHPVVCSRMAISSKVNFMEGDEVLVMGEDINCLYIIGILAQQRAVDGTSADRPSRISTPDGAYAAIEEKNGSIASETLRVYSRQRELIFEYDSTAKRAKVFFQSGNLEFITQEGDIILNAAKDIQLKGKNIEMAGRFGIKIGIADITKRFGSAILMRHRRMKFQSPEVKITSQRGRVFIDDMQYLGKIFFGKVRRMRIFAHQVEKTFKTVIEKAENTYTTIKRLSQLKAGRKRTIVESTYHLKAKRSILKAEDDFKVNANKIHLG